MGPPGVFSVLPMRAGIWWDMRNVTFILGIGLGLGLAIFALQNGTPVAVHFLTWQIDGPLAGVVLGSASAGALLALLLVLPQVFTLRFTLRARERDLAALQAKPAPLSPPPAAAPAKPPSPPPTQHL